MKIFLKLILFMLAGFFLGWLAHGKLSNSPAENLPIRESGYKYINPALICGISENKEFEQFKPLDNKVSDLIESKINNGLAQKISVYFRDMKIDRWFGINENEQYAPASLLKVPNMIAFYRLAESKPEILQKKILYTGSFDDNRAEEIKPTQPLQAGNYYTIEELIEAMILYSDNNAARILHSNINDELLREIYTDLGLSIPQLDSNGVDFMSAKSYSRFFRILYNSTYLNREFSEKALALLTKSDFPQGIIAGVPKNTITAQKFGERVVYSPSGSIQWRELHDCGIIYYPNHPYLLCVMTKGENFNNLTDTIREISALVHNEVENEYKN